jgi:hypothetical protein
LKNIASEGEVFFWDVVAGHRRVLDVLREHVIDTREEVCGERDVRQLIPPPMAV